MMNLTYFCGKVTDMDPHMLPRAFVVIFVCDIVADGDSHMHPQAFVVIFVPVSNTMVLQISLVVVLIYRPTRTQMRSSKFRLK